MTRQDAARALGVTILTVDKMRSEGNLHTYHVGPARRLVRLSVEEVEAHITEGRADTADDIAARRRRVSA